MKKLGFGLMRLPVHFKLPTLINLGMVKKMTDYFIDNGFVYFDTAYMYHLSKSESTVRIALVDRHKREDFILADKLPVMAPFIRNKEQQETIFEKQLAKCGVEYFDYYLIHSLTAKSYKLAKELDSFSFVQQKKAEGKIKHVGFSFHDNAEVLDLILSEHPEVEFVQLQINYLDWDSPRVQSRRCYEVAVKHGKPVIVMEPVKGGTLAKLPAEAEKLLKDYNPNASIASWAIRFAASLDNVMVVLSGMSNFEQIQDNTNFMRNFEPLNEKERAIIAKVVDIIKGTITVPCTTCGYCVAGCPKKIPIPQFFTLYNKAMQNPNKPNAYSSSYKKLAKKYCSAADCIECGKCESSCPQHLSIIKYLKDVSKHFDLKENKIDNK